MLTYNDYRCYGSTLMALLTMALLTTYRCDGNSLLSLLWVYHYRCDGNSRYMRERCTRSCSLCDTAAMRKRLGRVPAARLAARRLAAAQNVARRERPLQPEPSPGPNPNPNTAPPPSPNPNPNPNPNPAQVHDFSSEAIAEWRDPRETK